MRDNHKDHVHGRGLFIGMTLADFLTRIGAQKPCIINRSSVVSKQMEKHCNQAEMFHDVLEALKAIETRIKDATAKYARSQCGNKSLMKYQKILDTCALQIKAIEMIGFSNTAQYHNVRNMLITAELAMDRARAQRKSSDYITE